MMKNIKYILAITMLLPILTLAVASPVSALTVDDAFIGPDKTRIDGVVNTDALAGEVGLGVKDPRAVAASVINVILGFLGIIAVVIILVGGFKWMTAQGNDDKVGEAKQLLTAGVIGLVIVLAAFGIAKFVIGALIGATQ